MLSIPISWEEKCFLEKKNNRLWCIIFGEKVSNRVTKVKCHQQNTGGPLRHISVVSQCGGCPEHVVNAQKGEDRLG